MSCASLSPLRWRLRSPRSSPAHRLRYRHDGAVIVAADVSLVNTDTGVTQTAQTNESGAFNFTLVQPGTYELACESVGFKAYRQSGLVMETGLTKTVTIQLEIGEITETIEVTGSAPLLETENTTVGQFIERTTVAQMPVGSRQAGQLIKLAGNVTFARSGGGLYDLPFFSMAGGRSRNQMWHLDGGVVQNMALGIAQLNLNPPVESLREFKVESNNYAAEFGRSGNGLIIMSTRSERTTSTAPSITTSATTSSTLGRSSPRGSPPSATTSSEDP